MINNKPISRLREPGGLWLIVVGLPDHLIKGLLMQMRHQNPDQSITILIGPNQKLKAGLADEVWVFDRLGPSGFLALIRRASWRHFDQVYQGTITSAKPHLAWLKWMIWPRPKWAIIDVEDMSALDLRAG